MGKQPQERLFHPGKAAKHRPLPGGQRRFGGQAAVGSDEGHYRFSPGEIQFAVYKGPAGKFPRPRRPGPGGQRRPQHPAKQVHAPVAGKLHHILPRVAVGVTEHGGHTFVNISIGIVHVAVAGGVPRQSREGLARRQCPEYPVAHRQRLRPGEPDHPQSGGCRRGGNGGNGAAVGVDAHEIHLDFIGVYFWNIPCFCYIIVVLYGLYSVFALFAYIIVFYTIEGKMSKGLCSELYYLFFILYSLFFCVVYGFRFCCGKGRNHILQTDDLFVARGRAMPSPTKKR